MSGKPAESMVLSRERRPNAGARMADLLNKEDCDDFYQSTYGGFFDEEGDEVYESPESESDYVDSDFDIDENEKVGADDDKDEDYEEETDKRKKSAKAYKEPGYRQKAPTSAPTTESEPKAKSSGHESLSVAPKLGRAFFPPEEKKLRRSTVLKSEEYERRREERREKRARRKKYCRASEYYEKPSQAELLREAKETEELNLKSLERFQQYELEKRKRHRMGKQRLIKGPYIRYVSLAMPAILQGNGSSSASLRRSDSNSTSAVAGSNQNVASTGRSRAVSKFYLGDEQSNSTSGPSTPSIDIDHPSRSENDVVVSQQARKSQVESNPGKCGRTFITFSDDATFDRFVPDSKKSAKLVQPKTQYCVVTGLPAKYLDPVTKLPYANTEAFKVIRESYYKHVEEKGDKKEPVIASWLQSRRVST